MSSEVAMPKLVLVTGANGYIGSMLVKTLLEQGHNVRGTVRDITDGKKTTALKTFPNASTHLELVPLELTGKKEMFRAAMKDVEWVMHVASPVSLTEKDEHKLISPAVDGTVSILQAANETHSVKKFVLTSSISAISEGHGFSPDQIVSEETWTNLDGPNIDSYAKSKTLAEQTAWNYMKQENPKFTLTVINPAIVLGPVPSPQSSERTSAVILPRIFQAKDPGSIHVFFPMVDVRDVVQAHLQAAKIPEAAGKRFIVCANNGEIYMSDMNRILAKHFNPMGYKIRTWVVPRWMVWILSLFDEDVAALYYMVDAFFRFDNSRSKEILKLEYIPEQTLIDGAYSIVEHGIVPKTPGYTDR